VTEAGDSEDPGPREKGRRTLGPARPWETLGIAAIMLVACGLWGSLMTLSGVPYDGTLFSTLAVMAPPACLVAALVLQGYV